MSTGYQLDQCHVVAATLLEIRVFVFIALQDENLFGVVS